MYSSLSRKHFLHLVSFGVAGISTRAIAQDSKQQKPPPLDAALVKEFVTKAHSDLERVKELLAQQPTLLNAAWDWGGGDFETAMEAAGHMGRSDIANYLLSNGARINIFCAAMLGKIEIVRATLNAFPELKSSKGPHGLQLIHHAKKGGENAQAVLAFLESIGAS